MVVNSRARTAWDKLGQPFRARLIWTIWFITWILLVIGLFDRAFYQHVCLFTILHAALFLWLFRFRISPFPIQVRLAYVAWVFAGTYVPALVILMYIATVGLVGNLFFRYCLLARLMTLLPWNRQEPFSWGLFRRTLTTPPVQGKFTPSPKP